MAREQTRQGEERVDWPGLVARLEASGEPLSVFAARQGVRPATLGWWRWRLRPGGASPAGSAAGGAFARVMVLDGASVAHAAGPLACGARDGAAGIEFTLPSGVVIRVPGTLSLADVAQLASLLGAA